MLTRCPACETVFRVQPETLRIAHGQVRCGRCGEQFNALDSLADGPEFFLAAATPKPQPGAAAAASDAPVSATAEPDATVAEAHEPAVSEPEVSEPEVSEPEVSEPEVSEPEVSEPEVSEPEVSAPKAAEPELAPETVPVLSSDVIQAALLLDEPARRSPWLRMFGYAAILILLLALAAQWIYMQRVPLSERPALRPWLERICAAVDCSLPLPRGLDRLEIIDRSVRESGGAESVLLVELIFISRAERTIAYPQLELALTDVSGNRAANRRFSPAEYLPAGTDIAAGLPPQQPVRVRLELAPPSIKVVSYFFEFH